MMSNEWVTGDIGAMPAGRMIGHSLIESLLRGLGIHEDAPEMKEVARICGYVHNIPPKEVSVETFSALLHWLADHYYPQLAHSDALFEIGTKLFEGYRNTILGRVQLAALSIMGPDWLARRYGQITSKNSNFGERTVEELGPHRFVIKYRAVPLPGDYILGVMKGGLRAAGVEKPALSWKQVGPEDMDFWASW